MGGGTHVKTLNKSYDTTLFITCYNLLKWQVVHLTINIKDKNKNEKINNINSSCFRGIFCLIILFLILFWEKKNYLKTNEIRVLEFLYFLNYGEKICGGGGGVGLESCWEY